MSMIVKQAMRELIEEKNVPVRISNLYLKIKEIENRNVDQQVNDKVSCTE